MKSDLAVDGFGYWLAGFIDGEGSFLITKTKRLSGPSFGLMFLLALRDDDAVILYEIVDRTGIGEVALRNRSCDNCGDVATWTVRRRDDVLALCAILDVYPLRAKKRGDYEIWREAARVWDGVRVGGRPTNRERANRPIWNRLEELRALLSDEREYPFVREVASS